jgi:hypothetical protein
VTYVRVMRRVCSSIVQLSKISLFVVTPAMVKPNQNSGTYRLFACNVDGSDNYHHLELATALRMLKTTHKILYQYKFLDNHQYIWRLPYTTKQKSGCWKLWNSLFHWSLCCPVTAHHVSHEYKVVLFPANCNRQLQSLYLGIILALKCHYRSSSFKRQLPSYMAGSNEMCLLCIL